jgi:signal transduction histidine kinase
LTIEVDCTPPDLVFDGETQDLQEMVGNLLDNACKWGRGQVQVRACPDQGRLCLTVSDDGPGLPEALREQVLARGVRADEQVPGSGLGLDIVREVARLYGGTLALDRSELGGLRVTLRLPGHAESPPASTRQ